MLQFLFPCDPFNRKEPDENYAEEFASFKEAETACALFSSEDFDSGDFKPRPPILEGAQVLYRGWMLRPEQYEALARAVEAKGGELLTTPTQYRLCHYLPEWYPACSDLTPATVFLSRNADFESELPRLGWSVYFVKDYVKSLTTRRGSVARTPGEVAEIVDAIEKYRGQIEGGVCIREFENLVAQTEERYFVYKGRAFGRLGDVPALVREIAARIDSPFFSVDVIEDAEGALRLVELGDGQVSDLKRWTPARFTEVFGE